jgi:DNA-binding transcriptional regulator YdaS (Cro superfamily)
MKKRSLLYKYLKAERGRLKKLAAALNITPAAINQWKVIPADKLVAISRETGIPRYELRPDLYEGLMVQERPEPTQESAA